MSELFELGLCGGAAERIYRRNRPDADELPWHLVELRGVDGAAIVAARREWTDASMQEYASAGNISLTLRALLRARVPLDFSGAMAQFAVEEIEHAELCARVAGALGGGTPLAYERAQVFPLPSDDDCEPIVAATERVVREFCVGEAMSLALLTACRRAACRRAARAPLHQQVLARLVDDEKRHAAFGWLFLDWAAPQLDKRGLARAARSAHTAMVEMERFVARVEARQGIPSSLGMIGPLGRERYVECARRALERSVRRPLARFRLSPR